MAYALLIISVFLFASSLVGIRAALADYSPLELAVFRFIVASLTLAIVALRAGIRLPARKDLRLAIFIGFIFFLNMIGSNYGLKTVTAGEASFILNTVPLLTVVLAFFVLREKLSTRFVAGLTISFAGVSLITLINMDGLSVNPGILFLFLAAVTFAVFQISQKRLLDDYSPLEVTCYAIWGAAILLLPFGYSLPEAVLSSSLHGSLSAVYLGIFPSAVAYIIWFMALDKTPVSRAAIFFYLSPVFTVVIGYFWLDEIPSLAALGGGALVVGGVFIAHE